MIIVKATKDTENGGVLPDDEFMEKMNKFNEELAEAGVLLSYEGLHPSSKGARVQFSGQKRSVTDGPFAETKELIAGFWIWKLNSLEEAIEWVKRCPSTDDDESEIEIRQIGELEDFAPVFSEDDIQKEKNFRAELAERLAKK
jgi:hypothetical protein